MEVIYGRLICPIHGLTLKALKLEDGSEVCWDCVEVVILQVQRKPCKVTANTGMIHVA